MTQFTEQQMNFINAVRDTATSIRLDAVAGSGKTTTLVEASKQIKPYLKTVALAFNKATADELARRFPSNVESKTLNSIGNGVWFRAVGKVNLSTRKIGTIVTELMSKYNLNKLDDKEALWVALKDIVVSARGGGFVPIECMPRTYYRAEEYTVDVCEAICEELDVDFDPAKMFKLTNEILRVSIMQAYSTTIDFDDQIYMSTYFAPDKSWPQYNVIMVDEAQDLSTVQHDMLFRLGGTARLIVVGDANQAIYGWRGASCHSLDELTARFGLTKMPLTVCFRCPSNIVAEAKRIVPHIVANEQGGTVTVIPHGKEHRPLMLDEIKLGGAILCRNNAPLVKVGFALITAGIPCFFASRDIGAGLKKIIKGFPGKARIQDETKAWFEAELDKLKAKNKLSSIARLEDKYECINSIILGVAAVTKDQLIAGLDMLFLRNPSSSAIELTTIHKAKGKEWKHVYFLNQHLIPSKGVTKMVEAGVPGSEDLLKQEWNLMYVAVTRSLSTLTYFRVDKDDELYTTAEWENT